jgi:Trypsin
MKKLFGLAAVAALALPVVAQAGNVVSGVSAGGLAWTAESNIVGVTSTATAVGGGNPIYRAPAAQAAGIVSIIMQTSRGGFICSGTLLNDRRSIATAAHCVTNGSNALAIEQTTVYFNNGANPDSVTYVDPASTAVHVSEYFVNSAYTGEVIDQNDIVILRLEQFAPAFATSFGLYTGDLTGQDFTVSGYGARSDTGGSVGANLGVGRLRQGDNRFDFALGDADFGGFFTDLDSNGENFFGTADIRYSFLSDFDNGTRARDASCRLAVNGLGIAASAKYCDGGRGAREVSVAGGDSGGPSFINGQLAAITSYGLSFGPNFGDSDTVLNSSFGEFNGFVPISIHQAFIERAMSAIPESSTWTMMIAGFGFVGAAMRRRPSKVTFATA